MSEKVKNLEEITTLDIQLNHLARFIQTRAVSQSDEMECPPYPSLKNENSVYLKFITEHQLSFAEQTLLLLSLIPHIQPDFFFNTLSAQRMQKIPFLQIGGVKDQTQQYFLPTLETFLYIMSGRNLKKRFELQKEFSLSHWLFKKSILTLSKTDTGEPITSAKIILEPEYIELFTTGTRTLPQLSMSFPAQHITTDQSWEDIVLAEATLIQIQEIKTWMDHHKELMYGNQWQMHHKLKPGYRALFYGPPGTGKTLTATLLGKYTGKDVFRIDLSTVVSKYIGETEKNLSNLFRKAQNKDWILFFDEADALFGKRTNVKNAHDRYANQEVSYLLQRVEEFPGLIILASNLKANMDDAFLRRFNAIIHFPFPEQKDRELIWRKSFPPTISFENQMDIPQEASKYELAGGNIINVVQYACLQSIARGLQIIQWKDVQAGIRKEIEKEGKLFKHL